MTAAAPNGHHPPPLTPADPDADSAPLHTAPRPVDRFTGALLGMAIGDALGVPASGVTSAPISGYQPRRDADGNETARAGDFSAHTELALCIVETLVSNNGFIDPMNAGYRFAQILDSDNAHYLDDDTRAALEQVRDSGDYQAGLAFDHAAQAGPAVRVLPIGLVHALSRVNAELLVREVMRTTLITHADPDVVNGALAAAWAIGLVVRREVPPQLLLAELLAFIDADTTAECLRSAEHALMRADDPEAALDAIGRGDTLSEVVARACYLFALAPDDFADTTLRAVNSGADASATGAIAGALCGAWCGARAIPTDLVDGLDGRVYLLMASPALYRTAQRRAGLFLQLHERP